MRTVSINSASQLELSHVPEIGPERARLLAHNRPFSDWAQVGKVAGFKQGTIDTLRQSRLTLDHRLVTNINLERADL